jgi:hypothetical protein
MSSESAAETVYFREGNVLITSARADFAGRTYAIRHINSVEMGVKRSSQQWWVMLIIASAGLFMLSLINWISSQNTSSGYCTAIGLFSAIAGVALYRQSRDRYIVQITTSSGRVDALASKNRDDIDKIVEAVKRAITTG